MNSEPIGVFDSGLGGLTAVRRLRAVLPGEDIVFLGDTGHVPYGNRPVETLRRYAGQNLRFLLEKRAKAVVVACGTVSAVALDALADAGVPVCGVVEPAAKKAVSVSRSGRIGVIATSAAIQSGAYEKALRRQNAACEVTARACPLFVPLVESGHLSPGDRMLELVAEEYLSGFREARVDTLILGCTHYPLIREVIGACVGGDVALVDVGAEAADTMGSLLASRGLLAERDGPGELNCYVTDGGTRFAELAARFLQETDVRVWQTEVGI